MKNEEIKSNKTCGDEESGHGRTGQELNLGIWWVFDDGILGFLRRTHLQVEVICFSPFFRKQRRKVKNNGEVVKIKYVYSFLQPSVLTEGILYYQILQPNPYVLLNLQVLGVK